MAPDPPRRTAREYRRRLFHACQVAGLHEGSWNASFLRELRAAGLEIARERPAVDPLAYPEGGYAFSAPAAHDPSAADAWPEMSWVVWSAVPQPQPGVNAP